MKVKQPLNDAHSRRTCLHMTSMVLAACGGRLPSRPPRRKPSLRRSHVGTVQRSRCRSRLELPGRTSPIRAQVRARFDGIVLHRDFKGRVAEVQGRRAALQIDPRLCRPLKQRRKAACRRRRPVWFRPRTGRENTRCSSPRMRSASQDYDTNAVAAQGQAAADVRQARDDGRDGPESKSISPTCLADCGSQRPVVASRRGRAMCSERPRR